MIGITLATEDELSEEVGLKLAREAGFTVDQALRRGGNGYLRSRISSFCRMALLYPVFVVTDLDREPCASRLITKWCRNYQRPPNLLIRVAVREIEAWVLADHKAMYSLLGTPTGALPRQPDKLPDPKRTLLRAARRAPRRVREELLPIDGALASQGLGYNSRLCEVIRTTWSSERAAQRSPSLSRARQRLGELFQRISP